MVDDRMSHQVMRMCMKMYKQPESWPALEAVSKYVAELAPRKPEGWLNWANALREQDKIEDAKEVAREALDQHPNNATLRLNLGCYCSLHGEVQEAMHRQGQSSKGMSEMLLKWVPYRNAST